MKFLVILLLPIALAMILTGCGKKNQSEEAGFVYNNKDLGYSITLPKQFEYYQTQRKSADEYTDTEFFVPTSDRAYSQEIQSYAKPVVVRIVSKKNWEDNTKTYQNNLYEKIGLKGDKVYLIRFWKDVPSDWISKWNDQMRDSIKNSFKNI